MISKWIATIAVSLLLLTTGFLLNKGCTDKTPFSLVPLPDGQIAQVPVGNELHYKQTVTSNDKSIIDQKNHGISQGANASGGDIKGTALSPELNLEQGTATGGNFKFDIKQLKSGASVIIIAGILFIVAGVVLLIIFKSWTWCIICVGAGILLIACGVVAESYPWFYLVALAGIVGVVAYGIYRGFVHKTTTTALQTVVTGVEATPAETQTATKASIATAAGDDYAKVKATISKIKTDLGM